MKNNPLGDKFDRVVSASKKSRTSPLTNRRVRLWLANLEERTVPAVVSVLPEVLSSNAGALTTDYAAGGYSPQVAINPLNSQWIVEVHATARGPAGSFSIDGGQNWATIAFPVQPFIDDNPQVPNTAVYDPNIYQGTAPFKTAFAVTEDVSVAFDKQGNFYVVSNQHDAANANGAIVIQKFSMAGGTPTDVSTQRLYSYRGEDRAYNPVVAINTNQSSYTDPQSGAVTTDTLADQAFLANTKTTAVALTPTDTTISVLSTANLPAQVPFLIQVDNEQMKVTAVNTFLNTITVVRGVNGTAAVAHGVSTTVATLSPVPKGIYVAWSVNTTQTPNIGLPTTVSRIVTMVSADGGATFTTQQRVSGAGVAINASSPKIVFSQSGGELNFFYDYDAITPPPAPQVPNGVAIDKSIPDGGVTNAAVAATQSFQANALGPIQDALGNNATITTRTNIPLTAASNFLFVPNDAQAAFFNVGDNFTIAINATTNEEFRINSILSTVTTIAPANAVISPAATTITVASAAAFQVGDVALINGVEQVLITLITGNTLTVTRAQNGTTAVAHAGGNTVENLSQIRWNIARGLNNTTPSNHADNSLITRVNAANSVPVDTEFTQQVLIDAANLTSIKDLDVRLSVAHPNLEHLRIVLTPPPSSGIQPIILVLNRLDDTGAVQGGTNPVGLTGRNLGVIELQTGPFAEYNAVGTVFNQSADRSIAADNATAPYIGYFRPEAGTLDGVVGKTNLQLSGEWKLTFTDFVNDPPFPAGTRQELLDWTLNFTGVVSTDRVEDLPNNPGIVIGANAFGVDADTGVAITLPPATIPVTPPVLPSVTNVYPLTNAATGPAGIGHGVSIAVDTTLGGFSPYQGRMYLAYNGGGASNTNVYMVTSDDGGLTWSAEVQVNDDVLTDNFSEGNRPQFTPTVAVDPITGTVVVSYYDARNDAAGARVAMAVVTSIDGGKTFSKVAYANPMHTSIDFLTGKLINVEPIPGNQPQAGALGFGDRQGLVAYAGNIVPVFASNVNGAGTSIFSARINTAAGPRVIYGDSGTVTNTFTSDLLTGVISYNNTFAADGTRQLDGFVVQFDRPIDVSSFTASDVVVQYKNAVTGAVSLIPLHATTGIQPLDMPQTANRGFGSNFIGVNASATQFFIRLATPQTSVGTYSYAIGNAVYDRIRSATSAVTPIATPPAYAAPFSNATPVALVDAGAVPGIATSVITGVPALPYGQVLAGVTVTLDISQLIVGQLDVTLISPRGTRILLSNQNGGIFSNYTNTTFSDASFQSIVSGTAPFTGTFRPEQALANLIGQDPSGDWTLEVVDQVAGTAVGTINSWSLNLTVGTNINGNAMDQNANALAGEGIAYVPGGNVSTLATGLTDSPTDSLVTLASVAGFPTAPYVIQIGTEQMLVSSVSGNTLNVIRGYNGTVPASHLANDAVTELVLLYASTTLDADFLAGATSLVVSIDNTGFPAAPFVIQIGTEQLRVTATDAFGNWTVIRGFNGTEQTDHLAGDVVVTVNAPDVYSNPSPKGSAGPTITGVPFASPFTSQTLPLIIPGLHVDRTSAPDSNGNYVATSIVTTTVSISGLSGGVLASTETDTQLTTGTLLDPLGLGILAAPNNTVQTITVTATTPPGLILPFIATIQNEMVQVNAIVGNQWTVVRGIGGTAAVAHGPATPVNYTLQLTNSTTITAPITVKPANSTDIFTVAATGPSGAAVPFFAQIGTETVRVTAVNGNQWTVLRGANNTVPVALAAGTALNFNVPLTASLPVFARLDNEIIAITAITGSTLTVVRGLDNTVAVPHLDDAVMSDVGGLASLSTKIRVSSSVGFPTTSVTNPFTIQINGEMLSVTAIDTVNNIWTVVRGLNGTTIADDHRNGTTITYVPTTNVALNTTASFVDITFDRAVNPATFDGTDILGITGPLGAIAGPFTVTANPAGTPGNMTNRVFRIGFPPQALSGNYNVSIAPTISDTAGNQVDQNLNAGLDILRGTADPLTTALERPVYGISPNLTIGANKTVSVQLTVTDVFNIVQSTTQLSFSGPTGTSLNQTGGLIADPANTSFTVLSNLGFPSTSSGVPFVVQIDAEQIQVVDNTTTTWTVVRGFNGTTVAAHANGTQIKLGEPNTIQVLLNVNFPDLRNISATLTSPDGKVVNLFLTNTAGRFGTRANLVNTVFDDSASTPIQSANSPVSSGPFNPQFPLSVLAGSSSAGKWTLTIRNTGTNTGTINRFELRLPRVVPTNGIGEPVADRITAAFRVFTFASSNPQSSDQWTPVGPVGNTLDPSANGDNGGPVDSFTVDPSDPTGNTAYAGALTGGIWKTTNFLTTDPAGPNWLPLTDFGPGNSLNIGSIAVFPRNNDPSQTIIMAATGNQGSVRQNGSPVTPNTTNTTGGPGVGFLRSMDV